MVKIAILGGVSGASIAREVKKWNIQTVIIAGKESEVDTSVSDYVCVTDLRNKEEIYVYLAKLGIKYMIVGTGHILAIELCEYLISKGIKINLDIDLLKLYKNKYKTKEILKSNNILVPEQKLMKIEKIKECKGIIPCVIKSIKDKFLPTLINNEIELMDFFRKTTDKEVMVEEYIAGNDITAMVSNINNEIEVFPIYWSKGKENKLNGFKNSYSRPLSNEMEKILVENAKKVTKILRLEGVFRIDYIVEEEKIFFLEVNSIFVSALSGSNYSYQFYKKGIDRAKYLVEYALNEFCIIDKLNRKESTLCLEYTKEYDKEEVTLFFDKSVIDEVVETVEGKIEAKDINKLLYYMMIIIKSACDKIVVSNNDDKFIIKEASNILHRDIVFCNRRF